MLLLMIQAKRDEQADFRIVIILNQPEHVVIDIFAVCGNSRYAGPGQQAAAVPRVHFPPRLVIGVKEVVILLIEDLVSGAMNQQYELFEEPGRVCQMPFCRADAGHRLHNEILNFECPAQVHRAAPYAQVPLG